ncbi:MAG: hypothetical protein ACFBSG_10470 [Leptolyngbyaceae cyanobacterium]
MSSLVEADRRLAVTQADSRRSRPQTGGYSYRSGLGESAFSPQLRPARTSRSLNVSHASPLASLRPRDAAALDDLFEVEDLSDIQLDIHRHLARLYPEPCWEDEPYEFLHGFI